MKRTIRTKPVALKEVLQGLLRPGDWEALKQRRLIRGVWEAVLPPRLLSQTRLVEVRRRELWVEVTTPAWTQELQFLKPRVLEELEKSLGRGVIKDIRFSLGKI
ncbi:MAG: DUF721 domain-containing protein [Deltaproteobacteria bacterium]|nr:DUF721 domain-containing protein [Deltaproteobacteria bacterium]